MFLSKLEADVVSFQELQNKWSYMGTINVLYDLLKTVVTNRTRKGQNTYEEDGKIKYGGTYIFSFYLVASWVVDSKA